MEGLFTWCLVFLVMSRPPDLDVAAARAYFTQASSLSSWLHDEVSRRMADRLSCLRELPRRWIDWADVCGGGRSPSEPTRVLGPRVSAQEVWASGGQPAELLWSNLQLQMAEEPMAWMHAWHQALSVDGMVMFSTLGPDSFVELRRLYQKMGWGWPCQSFTDMHDWGDMMVECGFSEPVMDVERIVLTYRSAEALWLDMRTLGRNASVRRFAGLRTPAWKQAWLQAAHEHLTHGPDEPLCLTLEIIQGHAVRGKDTARVQEETHIDLQRMRRMLKGG